MKIMFNEKHVTVYAVDSSRIVIVLSGTDEEVNEKMLNYDDAHSNARFYDENKNRITWTEFDGDSLMFEIDENEKLDEQAGGSYFVVAPACM